MTEERGYDGLVFVRDRDRDAERETDVERGLSLAQERFGVVRIVGGTANEEIEAWLLALLGVRGSERHADAKAFLAKQHVIDVRDAKIEVVANADLDRVADDCSSFFRWKKRAQALKTS